MPTAFIMDQSLHMLQDAEAVQVRPFPMPSVASVAYLLSCMIQCSPTKSEPTGAIMKTTGIKILHASG